MPFLIMWQNVVIAALFGNEENVRYKIFFENLPLAREQGMRTSSILEYTPYGSIPKWIINRIPINTPDVFKYLKETEGRLETDKIWFQSA